MTGVRLVLAVLLTLLAQLTLVPRIGIAGIQPDATVLVLVLVAMRRGPVTGTLVGFFLGLFQDLLFPERLGLNMLAKSITGYVLGRVGGGLVVGGLGFYGILMGLAVLLHDFVFLLASTGVDLPRVFSMFVLRSLPSAAYTAVLGAVIVVIVSAMGGAGLLSPAEGESRASR